MTEPAPPSVADLAERARKARLPPQSIFAQHPAIGEQTLVDGTRCAVPYHSYHSDATIVWGAADAEWVKGAIKGPYTPLLGKDGRAQVALWAVEYKDTMLNPYKEYIIVFAVVPNGRGGTAPTVAFPHQQLQLFEDKQAYPYIYKLWLDKQLPTNYGRQLLGCDKYFDPAMKVEYGRRTLTMEAHHVEGELNAAEATTGPLVKGTIKFAEAGHLGSLISAFGLCRTLGMAAGVRGSWHVVNPPGIMDRTDSALYNPVWTFHFETSPKFTSAPKAKGTSTRAVAPSGLEYGGELKAMKFEALLFQHDPKLRAVLLPPWSYTAVADC